MQTTRNTWTSGAPTTQFYQGADIVAQSAAGNYSVVRMSLAAVNRGSSGSFSNYNGSQTGAIDGIGSMSKSGTLPAGVATGAERWDISKDITVPHAANGTRANVVLRHTIAGWFSNVETVAFGGFPRIPKPSSAPGTPVATEVLPTSLRLTWTAPTDNGGDTPYEYVIRRWDNPEGTGTYTDEYVVYATPTILLTGLTPGKEYRFAIYAHNTSYGAFSPASSAIVVRTLSGLWVKWEGVYRRAIPYVKVLGVYKAISVFIKSGGEYKRGG